jgi:Cytochrome P450
MQFKLTMASIIIVCVFVAVIIYRAFKYCVYRPENFPPGPFRIPVFGSYLLLLLIDHKNLHYAIEKLCKFYKSSVIGFYTGDYLTVVANDQKSVREVLFNPDFDGRNDFFIGRLREPNYMIKGIFFTDGVYWTEQRRFTLRNLRDFGFGRRFQDYEIEVRDELQSLINMIKEGPKYDHEKKFLRQGEVLLPKALIGSLGNCFVQVLCNERFSRADQAQIFRAGYGSMEFQVYSNEYGKLFSLLPWIRFFFPEMSSFKQLRDGSMEMCNLMKSIIDKQTQSYQDGHIRHFIDLYIKEMTAAQKANLKTGFLLDQLLMICTDFVFPSLSAIETTISFLFKHLLYRDDVLGMIQDEIDRVVGNGRLPELDDRTK